jgi:hypothetical protein
MHRRLNPLLLTGYFLFCFGVLMNIKHFYFDPAPRDFGIALGYGAIALLGLMLQPVAIELRKLQNRVAALEKMCKPASEERSAR